MALPYSKRCIPNFLIGTRGPGRLEERSPVAPDAQAAFVAAGVIERSEVVVQIEVMGGCQGMHPALDPSAGPLGVHPHMLRSASDERVQYVLAEPEVEGVAATAVRPGRIVLGVQNPREVRRQCA